MDSGTVAIAHREVDRFLGIGNQRRLFRSAGEVTQLVHPDTWTSVMFVADHSGQSIRAAYGDEPGACR